MADACGITIDYDFNYLLGFPELFVGNFFPIRVRTTEGLATVQLQSYPPDDKVNVWITRLSHNEREVGKVVTKIMPSVKHLVALVRECEEKLMSKCQICEVAKTKLTDGKCLECLKAFVSRVRGEECTICMEPTTNPAILIGWRCSSCKNGNGVICRRCLRRYESKTTIFKCPSCKKRPKCGICLRRMCTRSRSRSRSRSHSSEGEETESTLEE